MAQNKNFTIKNYTGTDYNILHPKTTSGQSLLDKSAQTTTGLASGSTLDDALQSVVKDGGIYQIGDTLTTSRTDLGDKWLLCNGNAVSSTTYPELSALLIASLGSSKLPDYSPADELYAYIKAK